MTDQPSGDRHKPEEPSTGQAAANAGGGVDLNAQRDVNVGGDVVGRDKIVGAEYKAAGKNIVQIGRLNIPIIPLVAALGIGLTALFFIGFGVTRIQQQVAQVQPTPTPSKMNGDFNVLVAEFGEQTADGKVQSTERSRQLSQTVFETLAAQKDSISDVAIKTAVALRYGDSASTGLIVTDEPSAAQAAQRVGAQMVIYGLLDPQGSFVPRFYVVPETRGEIDVLNTGSFQFGDQPIQFKAGSQFNADADLRTRSGALMYIIIGLTYDLFGRVEQSLAVYQQAEDQLKIWPEKSQGKEILYFFLGQAAFYKQFKTDDQKAANALNDEAQAAFERALSSNPAYTRAMIGLGGVHNMRLQRLPSIATALGTSDLGDMFNWYEKALDLARQGSDQFMENNALFSLAGAYYLQGAAYRFSGDAANATASFEKAIELIDPAEQYFRNAQRQRELAQVYLLRGDIYKQHAETASGQNNRTGAATLYDDARRYYQLCIDQATHAPEDRMVTEVIVRDKCTPLLQKVQSALNTP